MYLNSTLTNSDYSNNLRSNFSSETKIQLYKVTQIGIKPQIKISSNHQNVKEQSRIIFKLYEGTTLFQVKITLTSKYTCEYNVFYQEINNLTYGLFEILFLPLKYSNLMKYSNLT